MREPLRRPREGCVLPPIGPPQAHSSSNAAAPRRHQLLRRQDRSSLPPLFGGDPPSGGVILVTHPHPPYAGARARCTGHRTRSLPPACSVHSHRLGRTSGGAYPPTRGAQRGTAGSWQLPACPCRDWVPHPGPSPQHRPVPLVAPLFWGGGTIFSNGHTTPTAGHGHKDRGGLSGISLNGREGDHGREEALVFALGLRGAKWVGCFSSEAG